MRALFKWPNPYKVIASYYISNVDNFEVLVELKSQSDNKYELPNVDFSTPTLNLKPKTLLLGIKLVPNLPNCKEILKSLPNGKEILQIYRMERKHWGSLSSC